MRTRFAGRVAIACAVMVFAGCGGGGSTGGGGPTVTVTVGGTVSGLSGTVVLRNNGADDLTLSDLTLPADGSFTFPAPINSGSLYNVTVFTQPAAQTCSVANGAATAETNVTNVAVTCAVNAFTGGGTVCGLAGTVVLQNNSGDNLTISADGPFTFITPVADGSPYSVTVLTQPALQSCSVGNGTGTITGGPVTNVTVTCATGFYTVGGSISGLSGTVVLRNNGGDDLSRSVNGPFTFSTAVLNTIGYNVTVLTQPLGQTCAVANGSGAGGANVTNVAVTCTKITGVWDVSLWDNAFWGP